MVVIGQWTKIGLSSRTIFKPLMSVSAHPPVQKYYADQYYKAITLSAPLPNRLFTSSDTPADGVANSVSVCTEGKRVNITFSLT
jgi:hypothetical protein